MVRCEAEPMPLVPNETYAVFMREVADVHRELFAENGDLYGEDVRVKVERCLAVRDSEVERAERLRVEYREPQKREMLIGMILENKVLDIIQAKAKIEEG